MLTGSDLRFDIWKDDNDQVNWEKYLEYFRREPAFGEEKSKDLIRIYLFLKKELGKEFLAKPCKDGRDLVNSWLWSRGRRYHELKWLSESLDYFKDRDCNYAKLIGKLRSPNKCNTEGMPFLIIGDSLRKAGLDVVFEPGTDFSSKPDLKIINQSENEVIYGEISYQEESDETRLIRSTYDFLFDYFHFKAPLISFSGKIHGFARREELLKVADYIMKIKEKAFREESIFTVSKEQTGGIIEFAVAHEKKLSELEALEITKRYGLNTIQGHALNLDYTSRLLSKIKDKIRQHKGNSPLMVYVPLDQHYFLLGFLEPDALVLNIKRTLSLFPHVIGVCMYVHLGDEADPVKEFFDLNFFERKMVFDHHVQHNTLFVLNNDFDPETGVLADTLRKLYVSFGKMCE